MVDGIVKVFSALHWGTLFQSISLFLEAVYCRLVNLRPSLLLRFIPLKSSLILSFLSAILAIALICCFSSCFLIELHIFTAWSLFLPVLNVLNYGLLYLIPLTLHTQLYCMSYTKCSQTCPCCGPLKLLARDSPCKSTNNMYKN